MSGYGAQIGDHFRLQKTRSLISRAVNHATFALTELRCDAPNHGLTTQIAPEDAFIVAVQLRDYSGDLWLDGKAQRVGLIGKGQATIYDLSIDTQAFLRTPFHCAQFYLPRKGIADFVSSHNGHQFGDLNCALGMPLDDPVWAHAAEAMAPALRMPHQSNQLFLDHLFQAVAAHLSYRYGNLSIRDRESRGGLAPWQLRLSQELILSKINEQVSLDELAAACGLSTIHFARAFKHSTGIPPYRWLMKKRIEKAQCLISEGIRSLHEIAIACGFVDQSHLTRIFLKHSGTTPGVWRREHLLR